MRGSHVPRALAGPDPARRIRLLAGAAAIVACAAAAGGCSGGTSPQAPSRAPLPGTLTEAVPVPEVPPDPPAAPIYPPETLVGAGDIAVCGQPGAEQTARLLDAIPGTVFTAGDNTYPSGTERSFTDCYHPTWGRHRARTRPAPGNHDYDVPGALPYFHYFGANAGGSRGYYSFQLGGWLVLSLNSNVPAGETSAQYLWARNELAAHPARCALAYWHHPVVSSGPNGDHAYMRPLWRLMAREKVELVIVGHDHLYERFAPMNADLEPDPAGVRQFTAGTGGAAPYPIAAAKRLSEVRASVWGVLKLTLLSDGYDWEFVAVPGARFHDAGSATCH